MVNIAVKQKIILEVFFRPVSLVGHPPLSPQGVLPASQRYLLREVVMFFIIRDVCTHIMLHPGTVCSGCGQLYFSPTPAPTRRHYYEYRSMEELPPMPHQLFNLHYSFRSVSRLDAPPLLR